ncbi:MAG: hypothetical protein PHH00_01525 [Candidatus Nanoarchaeia archaeon]|nr:hypothetical protein [Candidatus Nanoarchaeia archaeon]
MKKEEKGFNKKYILFGIIALVVIGAVVAFILLKPGQNQPGGSQCDVSPGEWVPQEEECQNNQSLQNQCNEFCSNHPDCCPGWSEGDYAGSQGGPGQALLPLPSDSDVASLTRNYVAKIKAIDEGPLIYEVGVAPKIISDEELDKMKATGFNTIQVLLVGKWEGDKIVFNEVNNRVLLNDIVAIKKKGMAVWVAISMGGAPTEGMVLADNYEKFKSGYMNLVNLSSPLMEEYKVEYFTVNNEPDMFFNLQTAWGTKSQINDDLIDFYPATIELARKSFYGKIINKMTSPDTGTDEFLAATFENVDIAGVDVGPYINDNFDMAIYKEGLDKFQIYATKAAAAGVKWMNAEYWLSDFGESPVSSKEHQLECVNAAFDAYLDATPKGVGFTYNEFATFSWQPDGEATRLAMKEFLGGL